MNAIHFSTAVIPDPDRLHPLLSADPQHPHIHRVDMPFRLTSSWQDEGCEIGLWEEGDRLLAWAVFQPPWWNLDYVIDPLAQGSSLEEEVLGWGQEQILGYAKRTGEEFYGSVEFFEDSPKVEQRVDYLEALGFQEFDWSTVRFEKNFNQGLPQPQLPEGFAIRPLRGTAEVEAYFNLHRAAFGSEKMTTGWRTVLSVYNTPFCLRWGWNLAKMVTSIKPKRGSSPPVVPGRLLNHLLGRCLFSN